jgi:hypothetical protein
LIIVFQRCTETGQRYRFTAVVCLKTNAVFITRQNSWQIKSTEARELASDFINLDDRIHAEFNLKYTSSFIKIFNLVKNCCFWEFYLTFCCKEQIHQQQRSR